MAQNLFYTRFACIQLTLQSFMRFIAIVLILAALLSGCSKGMTKLLKNPDPEYKLRMAEKFFVQKKYTKAQAVFEDVMPYYKTRPEFQDVYYKYAYCAYYQSDYLNAENLFKTFLEIFPNSPKAEEMEFMQAYCFYKQSPKPELDQTNTITAMGRFQIFINTHPGSERNAEAAKIIDICRGKLETKGYKGAMLYYDMGQFRAAGVSFTTLLNSYPDSEKGDEYKLMAIKSFFRFAELSVPDKKEERFNDVITQCNEFLDRFPGSKLKEEAESFLKQSQTNIKNIKDEQAKTSA